LIFSPKDFAIVALEFIPARWSYDVMMTHKKASTKPFDHFLENLEFRTAAVTRMMPDSMVCHTDDTPAKLNPF
jgi:hypothetical protein